MWRVQGVDFDGVVVDDGGMLALICLLDRGLVVE